MKSLARMWVFESFKSFPNDLENQTFQASDSDVQPDIVISRKVSKLLDIHDGFKV